MVCCSTGLLRGAERPPVSHASGNHSGNGVGGALLGWHCQWDGQREGSAPQVMLAEEVGLHNTLHIHVVYTRKLGQSMTCFSPPFAAPGYDWSGWLAQQ